jgi:hypothetical protein
MGRSPWTPPGKPAVSPDPFRMARFFPRSSGRTRFELSASGGFSWTRRPRGMIERERMESTVGGNLTMQRRVWEEPARFLPAGLGAEPPQFPGIHFRAGREGTLGEASRCRRARSAPRTKRCGFEAEPRERRAPGPQCGWGLETASEPSLTVHLVSFILAPGTSARGAELLAANRAVPRVRKLNLAITNAEEVPRCSCLVIGCGWSRARPWHC